MDAVHIDLDEAEATQVSSAAPDALAEVLQTILSDYKEHIEHLCYSDARYTLDEGSF